jgi:CcmD family protein
MDQKNFEFMFYGFTVAWLIVVIYVLTIVARERRLRGELERVRRMIEDREAERQRR